MEKSKNSMYLQKTTLKIAFYSNLMKMHFILSVHGVLLFLIFKQILNGASDTSTGGVILFVTDGKQDCSGVGSDPEPITSQKIIDRIKATKVRIITIAFG